jgi:hypothetical protein
MSEMTHFERQVGQMTRKTIHSVANVGLRRSTVSQK